MKPAIAMKEKLAASEPVLGLLVSFHLSLEVIEIAARAGLDYVIIDMEHLTHDAQLVADACRVARLARRWWRQWRLWTTPAAASFTSTAVPCWSRERSPASA